MDIKTSKRIEETFRTVEALVAAVEMYGSALDQAEARIKALEDALRTLDKRRTGNYGRTSIST